MFVQENVEKYTKVRYFCIGLTHTYTVLFIYFDFNKYLFCCYRCQVNGKILWLCEEHKNASRSETEKRYQDRFEQKSDDIPIPTGGKLLFVIPSG